MYYHDLSHLPQNERAKTNFDHPSALDISLYVQHLDQLVLGNPVEVPIYDFASHTRRGYRTIHPQNLIITEGILLFAVPEIRSRLDAKIFIGVPEKIRLERKIHRDISERERSKEFAEEQFHQTVQPIHQEFVIPSMRYADVTVDGTRNPSDLASSIIAHFKNEFGYLFNQNQ